MARRAAPCSASLRIPTTSATKSALTQTTGWVDAWTLEQSAFAVAAESAADVAAAVDFAREHNLRLVVRGGGHSYLGTSNSRDSLLIWTRRMAGIELHDAFVPAGTKAAPLPAVMVGPGAVWGHVYNAVTTKGARLVQGGGCLTVGVAGLVLGGGFGSYSRLYGTAAASLLEAEIVTADGAVRIANAATNPDLFWALKGGGGGTFGVVTRLTLRTHELPATAGKVNATIHAHSDAAFRRLIGRFVAFYAERLATPQWSDIVNLGRNNRLNISMGCLGLDQAQAEAIWQPFFAWVAAAGNDYSFIQPVRVFAGPARQRWDPDFLRVRAFPARSGPTTARARRATTSTGRPMSPRPGTTFSATNSVWLPAALLAANRQDALADALFATSRIWPMELHFQKALAGAPPEAIAATRDTAINPAVLDAFVLVIIGSEGAPAYPGLAGYSPDFANARHDACRGGEGHGRVAQGRAGTGLLPRRDQLFRARLAEIVLGFELSAPAANQRQIRPRRAVLRAPRSSAARTGAPTGLRSCLPSSVTQRWRVVLSVGYRRLLLVAVRPSEGRFSQPTAAVQAWRPELVFMPEAV